MPEMELHRRYPDSKPEDITDAYMRGLEAGIEIANSQHERDEAPARRIDALESRIEGLGYDTEWLTTIMKAHSARLDAMERKLNHKGGVE